MTAPSLLDELEEVVRLTDKATPGAWSLWGTPTPSQAIQSPDKLVMQTLGGNDVPNAEAVAAAMNFLRTHHAEIEAMARDAARYQTLKDADVWSDEVWHAIDERDSDGLDEALDAMHDSAREDGNE